MHIESSLVEVPVFASEASEVLESHSGFNPDFAPTVGQEAEGKGHTIALT